MALVAFSSHLIIDHQYFLDIFAIHYLNVIEHLLGFLHQIHKRQFLLGVHTVTVLGISICFVDLLFKFDIYGLSRW